MPILLVLMTIVFGSVAAASLPLAIGVFAIMGSFIALREIPSPCATAAGPTPRTHAANSARRSLRR
jgi:hypothetical protein